MTPRQRKSPEARRADLVTAAATLFAERGVSPTAVSDIVKAAGVAQGTFYLYFESKEAVVCAVVEALIHDLIARVEPLLVHSDVGAPEKLEALVVALREFSDEPYEIELMQAFHRPDNEQIHDRVARQVSEWLVPHITSIIQQGVAEGAFVSEDPESTARFILAALQGLAPFAGVEQTTEQVSLLRAFVLRGLGSSAARTDGASRLT